MPGKNLSRQEIIFYLLNEKGYPRDFERVLKGIPREDLEKIDFFLALKTRNVIGLAYLLYGKWEILGGTVDKVDFFPEGRLVFLTPYTGSFWAGWPVVLLWIPDSDNQVAGVLY